MLPLPPLNSEGTHASCGVQVRSRAVGLLHFHCVVGSVPCYYAVAYPDAVARDEIQPSACILDDA